MRRAVTIIRYPTKQDSGEKPSRAAIQVDKLLPQLTREELEKLRRHMSHRGDCRSHHARKAAGAVEQDGRLPVLRSLA
jgi:hypothetical protein